jgi:hypothetical protein
MDAELNSKSSTLGAAKSAMTNGVLVLFVAVMPQVMLRTVT